MNVSLASSGLGGAHAARANNQHATQLPDEGNTGRAAIAVEEIGLRHLRTPAEIERILHLREAIDLSVHSAAGCEFRALEKKEMSAVLSARSN